MVTKTISREYFNNLAGYLNVPSGKVTEIDGLFTHTNKNHSSRGVSNIIFSLLKESTSNLALPKNIVEESQIRQWLEYIIVYVGNAHNIQNIQLLLKELNGILSTKTYLIGNRLTIADVSLYFALLTIMANLSNLDKEKYLNVSRWFDNIQQDSALIQKNNKIDFSTNYLANLVPARH